MTYPALAYYLRWNFDLKLGDAVVDTASFGIHAFNPTVITGWDLDAVAAGAADAFKTTLGDSTFGIFSSVVNGRSVECYELGPDGKTKRKGLAPLAFTGGTVIAMPWQCSPVISLYDHDPKGFQRDARRHRGRFYLPPVNNTLVDTTGLITDTKQGGLLAKAKSFLDAVRHVTVAGGNPVPQIQSKVDQAYYEAKYVRVGRVVDTMRSRRNRLDEAYQQVALATS